MRRTGVWVSVFRNSVIHEIFFWILAAIPVYRNTTGRAVLYRGFRFYLVLDFWLAWSNNGSPSSIRSTCELDTGTGWESIPLRSSRARVSLSLNTFVVGDVDELEEDVGWSFSCLEGVIDVEEWELEEELADKPATTIGTKFSVIALYSNTVFLMRCGFWPLIHS